MFDIRPSFVAVTVFQGDQLIFNNLHPQILFFQDFLQFGDEFLNLFILFFDFLPFQAGESLKAHFKNGFRLNV